MSDTLGNPTSPVDTDTRRCAVIGNPVEHSLSPLMHNAAFAASGLNYVYVAFRVEDVSAFLTGVRAMPSFRGISVTIPHKMAVMPLLDAIEPMARHVGCVNTITNDDGKLAGAITDGAGVLEALSDAGASLDGARVLFLGSGGAVRAASFAVAELTAAAGVTILGRTPARVEAIVLDLQHNSPLQAQAGRLPEDLEAAMDSHDVVIHGTPLGMYPNPDASCIPPQYLRPAHVVFDMVYRPHQTRLLEDAQDAGCKTIPGVEMLVNQAVLQFERWTGADAPRDVMRAAVLGELTTQ